MERVAVVGLSLRETDLVGLESLARPAEDRVDEFTRELADELGASETVLIVTCNRLEVVFAREVGHLPSARDRELVADRLGLAAGDRLRGRMHFLAGRDAARHLFRVACSLDSVVVGEDQILAQVRGAYARSKSAGLIGRLLGTLFEHAFQIGKQVRAETELSRIPVSVVDLGLDAVVERRGTRVRLALVGAGAMAESVVRGALERELSIVSIANRTLARAELLATRCGAGALTLEELVNGHGRVDVVVCATSAPGYVLRADGLRGLAGRAPSGKPLLVVDLAVPRDVEPVDDPRVEIVDMEGLRSAAEVDRALRAASVAQAEELVQRKVDALMRRAAEVTLADTLADLRRESELVFEREMTQLFTGCLAEIDAEERRAIERWARTTFGRVTHVPIDAIKRLANDRMLFGPCGGGATP